MRLNAAAARAPDPRKRQHRSQPIACLGLLAALAVYAIVVSTSMRTAFSHDGLAACLARSRGTSYPAATGAPAATA
jgi:hypothetical protein